MEDELYEELALAFSEQYSEEELYDDAFMLVQADEMLGLTGEKALIIIEGAREFKRLWQDRKPEWKKLLAVN